MFWFAFLKSDLLAFPARMSAMASPAKSHK